MKKKLSISVFMLLVMSSCVCYKYRDSHYSLNPKDRGQCFFVVDTIDIEDPIVVKEKGENFIVSRSVLEKNDKRISNIFREADVYIAGFYEFNFYNFLSKRDLPRYLSKMSFYSETEDININGRSCMKFKSSNVSFILCLINANYYNNVMANSCDDWYMIKNREYKNTYYRIVFPILKSPVKTKKT